MKRHSDIESDIGRENRALRGPGIGADIAGGRGGVFRPGSGSCFSADAAAAIAARIVARQAAPVRLGDILPWVHVGLIAELEERLPADLDRGAWLAALAAAMSSARAGEL